MIVQARSGRICRILKQQMHYLVIFIENKSKLSEFLRAIMQANPN